MKKVKKTKLRPYTGEIHCNIRKWVGEKLKMRRYIKRFHKGYIKRIRIYFVNLGPMTSDDFKFDNVEDYHYLQSIWSKIAPKYTLYFSTYFNRKYNGKKRKEKPMFHNFTSELKNNNLEKRYGRYHIFKTFKNHGRFKKIKP